jgi:hypothetical protein
MGGGGSKDVRSTTNVVGAPYVCYAEATPGITTWLRNPKPPVGLSDQHSKSIDSRNAELREALGLTDDGRNNDLPLYMVRYIQDTSDNPSNPFLWAIGPTIFPVFNMDEASDIDAKWPYGPGIEIPRTDALNGTNYGWNLASHAKLQEFLTKGDTAKGFPFGRNASTHREPHLHKLQGFYGATIPCDSKHVATQNAKAIVINQASYADWDNGPIVPFTRLVFMFVLGEYEHGDNPKTRYRMCTAWRDYVMQEVVFIDLCTSTSDGTRADGSFNHLRKFFGQVASMNEAYDWDVRLAQDGPKPWTAKLGAQGRVATMQAPTIPQRFELSQLMSKNAFRVPPKLRALFLPDEEIKSGDTVHFVLDWPTCKRIVIAEGRGFLDGHSWQEVTKEQRPFKYTIGADSGITSGTTVRLHTIQKIRPDLAPEYRKIVWTIQPFQSAKLTFDHVGVLKSGMRVQMIAQSSNNSIGSLGLAVNVTNAAPSSARIKPRTSAGTVDLDFYELLATNANLTNWIVYKGLKTATSPPTVMPTAMPVGPQTTLTATPIPSVAGPTAGALTPATTTGAVPTGASVTGTLMRATSVASAASPKPGVTSGDWAVSYALTASAVADASLFSIDAVSYFGDKDTASLASAVPSRDATTKRELLGAALSALVLSAVAYDAVDHPTLLAKIPRPESISDSDEAALGVLAVRRPDRPDPGADFVCLASNVRLARALSALPRSTTLTGVSFSQMQLATDFTSSYFMRPNKTKLGTIMCRAFRLVPYNIAAVLAIVLAIVALLALLTASDPVAATRITRIYQRVRSAKSERPVP